MMAAPFPLPRRHLLASMVIEFLSFAPTGTASWSREELAGLYIAIGLDRPFELAAQVVAARANRDGAALDVPGAGRCG